MPFELNNKYGTGRPKNSRNKLPDRNQICELIDLIVSDFQQEYNKLTVNEKIKILEVFRNLFSNNLITYEQNIPDNEIKVTIIKPIE